MLKSVGRPDLQRKRHHDAASRLHKDSQFRSVYESSNRAAPVLSSRLRVAVGFGSLHLGAPGLVNKSSMSSSVVSRDSREEKINRHLHDGRFPPLPLPGCCCIVAKCYEVFGVWWPSASSITRAKSAILQSI